MVPLKRKKITMFHNIVLVEEIKIILYSSLPKRLLIRLILCHQKVTVFIRLKVPVGHWNILTDTASCDEHCCTNILYPNLLNTLYYIELYGVFVFISPLQFFAHLLYAHKHFKLKCVFNSQMLKINTNMLQNCDLYLG